MARNGVILRLARRSLLRDRWRALLVVVLIGLPVMGIATAALVLETAVPTPQERAIRTMGQADLRVTPIGSFGRARLVALLPAGSSIQPMWATGDRVVLPGTRLTTSVLFTDLHDLASGMATLLEGRLPEAVDEVAISSALATRAGVSLGGTLALDAQGRVRVVGLVEDPRDLSRALVLGAPALAEAPDQWPVWLVRLPDGVDAQSVAADLARAVDTGDTDTGQQMFDVETREQAGAASETFVTIVITLGALALVESALVASAAFAVGIRRRQRELGLLGAVGTTPRQMAGSVLAEGLLAGAVAVILGIVLGLASAWLISHRLDELTGQRTGSLVVDPMALLLAALVGLAAAIIAAAVPAWGAARLPTLVALSGRRPPVTPARRLLALGVALILVALACTLAAPMLGGSSEVLPLLMLVLGAVTGVLGFGACSPWLLERLEGVARRLPLAPRVALRDTARARTRNGPIVTAVLASIAATIALAAVLASQQAQALTFWRPEMAEDTLLIDATDVAAAGTGVARQMGAIGFGPQLEAHGPDFAWYYALVLPLLHPDPADDRVEDFVNIQVGDASLLAAYHGEAAADALADGRVVVLASPEVSVTGPMGRVMREPSGDGQEQVMGSVPVTVVPRQGPPDVGSVAIMSPATATSLGLIIDQRPEQYIVRLDHPITPADMARAATLVVQVDPAGYVRGPLPPADPMLSFRLLMLAASLLAALTVTGIAVALGETEARPDQRTLLALGAPRGLRRRVTASRGLVIALLAGLLAIPAGLLPVWGILMRLGWPLVVPIPEVIGALVVLPLAAVAGGMLLGRPIPEWSARRDRAG